MKEKQEIQKGIRKTIYIDENLFKRSEIMYSMAEVNSFSAFVAKAVENYIAQLVVKNHVSLFTEEITKAIDNALAPIDRRLSKGLYRYAIELDMLSQFIGYQHDFSYEEIAYIRKEANLRVAQMRGKIDVGELIGEPDDDYYSKPKN